MSDRVTVSDVAEEVDTLWVLPSGLGNNGMAHVDAECPQMTMKRDPVEKDPETLFADKPVCKVCHGD